jgi:hypothetical protein
MPGKYYLNGTCVNYAEVPFGNGKRKNIADVEQRELSKKSYKLNFKQKNSIYDTCTYQNAVASSNPFFSHLFFTLTMPTSVSDSESTKAVGKFMDKLKKYSYSLIDKQPMLEASDYDKFTYLWVRELTKKGHDHFHCCVTAPHWPIKKSQRRYPDIGYTIPWYHKDEQNIKQFTLNKAWNMSAFGEYLSPNAVRISRSKTGKYLFVIDNIQSAMMYVAKYVGKGDIDEKKQPELALKWQSKKRWDRSRHIVKSLQPTPCYDAITFAEHPLYGDPQYQVRHYNRDGECKRDDSYVSIGRVRAEWAYKIHQELEAEFYKKVAKQRERELLELKEQKIKKLRESQYSLL